MSETELAQSPAMAHYHECPWCGVLRLCYYQVCVEEANETYGFRSGWTEDNTIGDAAGCCRECHERRHSRLNVHRGQDDDGRAVELPRQRPN